LAPKFQLLAEILMRSNFIFIFFFLFFCYCYLFFLFYFFFFIFFLLLGKKSQQPERGG